MAHDPEAPVEIDVRGLLRLRLDGATGADRAAVERQVGLPSLTGSPAASGPPSIVLRYVDRLPDPAGSVRLVGSPDATWTDDGFALVRGRGDGARRVLIPFERVGGPIELVCERGIGRVPLLVPILNLTMLGRGVLPLHASAFTLDGEGIVAAGWSQSGKTEALLAAMAGGARMVADEWAYISPDRRVHGLPTPVRLESWHLRQLPDLAGRVRPGERRRVARSAALGRLHARVGRGVLRGVPGGRIVDRGLAAAAGSDHVDVSPAELFGQDRLEPSLPLERMYWLVPRRPADGADTAVRVTTVAPDEVVPRMAVAHIHHRLGFLDAYWRFRYAFGDLASPLVEELERRERDLLGAALRDLPIHRVDHPRRVDLAALGRALRETGRG